MFSFDDPDQFRRRRRSFQNNVPDPVTSGAELPTFKFELENLKGAWGRQLRQGSDRPTADLQGAGRRLDAHGAGRHARTALARDRRRMGLRHRGRVRTTVIDPQGCSETNDFEPGDVWYFPRGHGHVIETLGTSPAISSSSSTTAISRSSAHSASATGSATRRRSCSPRISAFPRRPSTDSRRRRSISPRAKSAGDPRAAVAGLEAAAAHPQIQAAVAEALRDFQRRHRMARRRLAISDFHDHDGRRTGNGAGRAARTALAPQCLRVAICARADSSTSRCSAQRGAGAKRSSNKATSATSHRALVIRSKMSATKGAHPHRLQQRPLPDHRSLAMDRRQSGQHPRNEFRAGRFGVREISAPRCLPDEVSCGNRGGARDCEAASYARGPVRLKVSAPFRRGRDR